MNNVNVINIYSCKMFTDYNYHVPWPKIVEWPRNFKTSQWYKFVINILIRSAKCIVRNLNTIIIPSTENVSRLFYVNVCCINTLRREELSFFLFFFFSFSWFSSSCIFPFIFLFFHYNVVSFRFSFKQSCGKTYLTIITYVYTFMW